MGVKPDTYKGIYAMHKYWSKKPPNIVSSFIEKFSKKGDIVLDPFSGYGVTGIEALALGRKAVLIDLNPVATFISKVIITPVSVHDVEKTFTHLVKTVKPVMNNLYQTECLYCGYENATATHYIHTDNEIRKIWFTCLQCNTKKGEKPPSRTDLDTLSYDAIPFWYPCNLHLFENSRINSKQAMSIQDFFTARNLYALSFLYDRIMKISDPRTRDFFKFVITASAPQMSNMVFVVKRRGKTSSEPRTQKEEVGSWVVGYWIPREHFEINVWKCFENRYRKVLRGKREAAHLLGTVRSGRSFSDLSGEAAILIRTADATNLQGLPDRSVDYIFTDPPHGDRIPYFELSSLWASWLGMDLNYENEIVVSNAKERGKHLRDYTERLCRAFKEMHRVLKDGKFISVAFNNLDDETWLSFVTGLTSAGFEIVDVSSMGYSAGSVVQDNRKRGLKSDFVFTCAKREGSLQG